MPQKYDDRWNPLPGYEKTTRKEDNASHRKAKAQQALKRQAARSGIVAVPAEYADIAKRGPGRPRNNG